MKRQVPRFLLPLLLAVSIPFVYNSCQGGFLGGKGFAASKASSVCKPVLDNGMVTKLQLKAGQVPSAFAYQKVKLREDLDSGSPLSKATGPLSLASGTQLGVVMSNLCLQQNKVNLGSTVISKAISETGTMLPDLQNQAYRWTLDRDYTDQEIEDLANQEPCVVGISWNKIYKIQATGMFNDPMYPSQTQLPAIQAEPSYSYFYNPEGGMDQIGDPVVIAVVDTGVDWLHPDLKADMWAHQNGIGIDITTLNSGLINYNPFDVSDIGHGTHVAGLIAAAANNSTGIVGAMPYRARIMAVKIFAVNSDGTLSTTSEDFYNGVQFAYLNGADVINLSLDSITHGAAADSLAQSALQEAVGHGVTVVTVIGNADSGANGEEVNGSTLSSIPAQYSTISGVIGVGAFDAVTGQKSFFSHYSTTYAEIGAPGAEQGTTGIYSTLPTSLSSYGRLAGTSQAGPLVSAAAGLTVGIIRDAYGVVPSPAEVERLILASADKSSMLTQYFKDGNRLNMLKLAQKINTDYPLTQSSNHVNLSSSGCP